MACFFANPFWAIVLSFLITFSVWFPHFVSLELEMPFGEDDSDLPITQYLNDFNLSLANLIDVHRGIHDGTDEPRYPFMRESVAHHDTAYKHDESGDKWVLDTVPTCISMTEEEMMYATRTRFGDKASSIVHPVNADPADSPGAQGKVIIIFPLCSSSRGRGGKEEYFF